MVDGDGDPFRFHVGKSSSAELGRRLENATEDAI